MENHNKAKGKPKTIKGTSLEIKRNILGDQPKITKNRSKSKHNQSKMISKSKESIGRSWGNQRNYLANKRKFIGRSWANHRYYTEQNF